MSDMTKYLMIPNITDAYDVNSSDNEIHQTTKFV